MLKAPGPSSTTIRPPSPSRTARWSRDTREPLPARSNSPCRAPAACPSPSTSSPCLFVALSDPANATIGRGQALGTILDDEATRFYPLTACRVLDTRLAVGSGGPIVSAGERRSFAVAGSCGIPSTAKAVAMNVTTVQQSTAGSLRLYPAGLATPPTSGINFAANHPRSNNGTLLLGTGGKATAQCDMPAGGQTQIIVDVFGYYQ